VIDSEHADEKPSLAAKVIRLSGFIAAGLSILTFLLTFVALTPPSPYQPLLWICVAAWLVLVVLWPLLQLSPVGARWNRWTIPALGFLILALGLSSVPFRLALVVSRGDMNRIAREVMDGQQDPSKIRWIGVYRVSYADGNRWGFSFEVKGTKNTILQTCEINTDSGFAFDKSSEFGELATLDTPPSFHKLGGGWHSFSSTCSEGA
jgi:hypothetical protein